jgi:uncharacterized protein YjiS (DUF1127 family)
MATLNLTGASAPIGISNSDVISSWTAISDLRKGRGLREHVASFLGRCFSHLAREYRVHCGVRAMMALDDRMLSDIGLTRTEIGSAAHYGRAQTN